MDRIAGAWHGLAVKFAQKSVPFGAACALLGASAASLVWVAFSGTNPPPPELVGVAINSNAGLVGEVVPDVDGLPLGPVPLHLRSDYRVEPPDVLLVKAGHLDSQAAEELLATSGHKLVQPDGTLDLGEFGSVHVAGLTPGEIELAIADRLHAKHAACDVAVSVFAQNSKVYYLIFADAEQGDEVHRYPVVGDETVLDALSQVPCRDELANKRIWIARPEPGGADTILPVGQWTSDQTATCNNYPLLSGDRIFIAQLPWWQQLLERAAALRNASAAETNSPFAVEWTGFHSR